MGLIHKPDIFKVKTTHLYFCSALTEQHRGSFSFQLSFLTHHMSPGGLLSFADDLKFWKNKSLMDILWILQSVAFPNRQCSSGNKNASVCCAGCHCRSSSDAVDGLWYRLHGAIFGHTSKKPEGIWSLFCRPACWQTPQWVRALPFFSPFSFTAQFTQTEKRSHAQLPSTSQNTEHVASTTLLTSRASGTHFTDNCERNNMF